MRAALESLRRSLAASAILLAMDVEFSEVERRREMGDGIDPTPRRHPAPAGSFVRVLGRDGAVHLARRGEAVTACGATLARGPVPLMVSCPACRRIGP